jgi:hypothetical protein
MLGKDTNTTAILALDHPVGAVIEVIHSLVVDILMVAFITFELEFV